MVGLNSEALAEVPSSKIEGHGEDVVHQMSFVHFGHYYLTILTPFLRRGLLKESSLYLGRRIKMAPGDTQIQQQAYLAGTLSFSNRLNPDTEHDEYPQGWREVVMRLYPNGRTPLTGLTSLMKSEKV